MQAAYLFGRLKTAFWFQVSFSKLSCSKYLKKQCLCCHEEIEDDSSVRSELPVPSDFNQEASLRVPLLMTNISRSLLIARA